MVTINHNRAVNGANSCRILDCGTRTSWTYDASGQLQRERRNGTGSFDVTHVYDPGGNRTVMIDSGTRTTATYDAGNELLVEKTGAARTTYQYDANGNTTRKDTGSALTIYDWDVRNRMTAAKPVGAPVTSTYTGDNNRVKKQVGGATKQFVYDFENLLRESDGGGSLQQEYTSTTEQYGDLLSAYDGSSSRYYEFDPQYSTEALLDDTGSVTDRYKYRAYGLASHPTGSSTQPQTFVGRQGYYADTEIDLYYVRRRYYDPITARWRSEDNDGYGANGSNLYWYGGNDPVNTTDPSGNIVFVPTAHRDALIEFYGAYGFKSDDFTYAYWSREGFSALFVPKPRRLRLALILKEVESRWSPWDKDAVRALATYLGRSAINRYVYWQSGWWKQDSIPRYDIASYADQFYKDIRSWGWLEGLTQVDPELLKPIEFSYVEAFKEAFTERCQELAEKAQAYLNQVTDFVTEFWEFAKQFLTRAFDVAGALITRAGTVFNTFLTGVGMGIENFVKNFSEVIPDVLSDWLLPAGGGVGASANEGLLDRLISAANFSWERILARVIDKFPLEIALRAEDFLKGKKYSELLNPANLGGSPASLLLDLAKPAVDELKSGEEGLALLKGALGTLLKGPIGKIYDVARSVFANQVQIKKIINNFLAGVDALLRDDPSGVASQLEIGLKNAIPLVLDVAASLLGVGDLRDKVRGWVTKITDPGSPIDGLIDKALTPFLSKLKIPIPSFGGIARPNTLGSVMPFVYRNAKGEESSHRVWLETTESKQVLLHVSGSEGTQKKADGTIGKDIKRIQDLYVELEKAKGTVAKAKDKKAAQQQAAAAKAKLDELRKAIDKVVRGIAKGTYSKQDKRALKDFRLITAANKEVSLEDFLESADCGCPAETETSSEQLSQNLVAGRCGPKDNKGISNRPEAHHIVPGAAKDGKHPRIKAIRDKLTSAPVCIGINDAINGVFLPKSHRTSTNPEPRRTFHNCTFRSDYYAFIVQQVDSVPANRMAVWNLLLSLRQFLIEHKQWPMLDFDPSAPRANCQDEDT